jgi:hypothetical protein
LPADTTLPSGRRRDPLLGTVRVALSVMMIAAIAVTATILATAPLLYIWRARIIAELSQRAGAALPGELAYAISGVQILVAVTAMLGFFFIRHLRRIIDSVADGDPFIPDNAQRLSHMGWLAVAIQLIAIPAGALGGWIAYIGHVQYIDIGFSFGGAFLALILFVLARIFRKGAEMRDELEGTV